MSFCNVGFSMRPLLYQGRDVAIIERQPNRQYRRGDIVLYKIYDKYFINRIARVFPGGYYFCEDNSGKTYLFFSPDCQIIGIMTSFLRNGKAYSVNDWRYRLYSFVWSFLVIPIRSSAKGTIKRISWIIHRGRVTRD